MIIQSKFSDFCRFAKLQIESTDIDPVYPVLRAAYAGVEREIALWRTLLYVAYYHLGSAERAWSRWPEPGIVPGGQVAIDETGIERRGFRGNDHAADFINATLHRAKRQGGTLASWTGWAAANGGKKGWSEARDEFESVHFMGPWASYKFVDLLAHVHFYQITAPDIGVGGNAKTAGPVSGLVALTGADWKSCLNPALQQRLYEKSIDAFVPFGGIEEMETALCDFNSLCEGRYYVGHDIDQMMGQLDPSSSFWAHRRTAIPERYLGEVRGWMGVDRARKRYYLDTGTIYARGNEP
jgi:hypothetical protein